MGPTDYSRWDNFSDGDDDDDDSDDHNSPICRDHFVSMLTEGEEHHGADARSPAVGARPTLKSKALTLWGSLPRVDGESTPSTDPPPPTILHRFVRCSGVTVNGQPTFEVEESDPSYDESEVSLWCTNNGLWQIGHTKYVGRNLAFLSGCMRVGEAQAHVNEPAAAPPAANLDRLEWRLHVGKNRWVDAPHFALYTDESIEQRLAAMAPTVHLVGALPPIGHFTAFGWAHMTSRTARSLKCKVGGQDDIEAKDGGDIKNTDGAQESTAAEESGGDGGRRVNGRPWYTLRRDKTYSLWWDKTGWQVGLTSDRGKRIGFIMTRESKALLPEWVPKATSRRPSQSEGGTTRGRPIPSRRCAS